MRYLTNPAGQHFPEHKAREIAPPQGVRSRKCTSRIGNAEGGGGSTLHRRGTYWNPGAGGLRMGFPPVESLGNPRPRVSQDRSIRGGGGNVTCMCAVQSHGHHRPSQNGCTLFWQYLTRNTQAAGLVILNTSSMLESNTCR